MFTNLNKFKVSSFEGRYSTLRPTPFLEPPKKQTRTLVRTSKPQKGRADDGGGRRVLLAQLQCLAVERAHPSIWPS